MLDYRLVEAFAAVVAEGGFERAAGVLHVTQSAVSQRVKMLEERTGCVLLVRSSPPEPTAAGRELLRHYRQVRWLEADLSMAGDDGEYATLPVGVNADSLATWFFPAVRDYLARERMLLDLRVDDQAETHRLLRGGDVLGCVSARDEPFQGCRAEYLGDMVYRLYCTPEYKHRWFPDGVTLAGMERAPMLIFNRKDVMHGELLAEALGAAPPAYQAFYLPSSERFAPTIASGLVCGMLPNQQAAEFAARRELVDLLPGHAVTVRLHWHCWNLASRRLTGFTNALAAGASRELGRAP
ncbi:LysR family transcriptional regulator ArgP [Pseudodesulfovibrio sp.]|uniref:LysR family transcriptional regulator ArgP n=1 Tax=Pseudodesulfovibrio sp. TaxID=2035812 RepID=UPI00262EA440|nr:LysR family transcriptional regulator ArgP [Pseudodesulfovibrio sp.]MDD3310547.1 LysR family transcriptional regulator ArgP [Pseudodesulfovibrio sp.]